MSASTTQSSTIVAKGREGWEAKTRIGMGIKNRVLIISTHKAQGGLVTSAQVMTLENGFLSFVMFGDFSRRTAHKGVRCTEKTVREIHAHALLVSDVTMSEAAAYYEAKDAKNKADDATEAAYIAARLVHGAIDFNEAHNY